MLLLAGQGCLLHGGKAGRGGMNACGCCMQVSRLAGHQSLIGHWVLQHACCMETYVCILQCTLAHMHVHVGGRLSVWHTIHRRGVVLACIGQVLFSTSQLAWWGGEQYRRYKPS